MALDDFDAPPIPAELATVAGPPDAYIDALTEATVNDDGAVEAVERWRIDDDGTAEWAMRRLASLREALGEARAMRDAWVARIDEWFNAASGPHSRRVGFFEAHLSDYARRRREADPTAKTLSLPSGKVTSRAAGARVVVAHDEAFLAWCRENGLEKELTRTKVEIDLAALKKMAEIVTHDGRPTVIIDGEEVPGVGIVDGHVDFTVAVGR